MLIGAEEFSLPVELAKRSSASDGRGDDSQGKDDCALESQNEKTSFQRSDDCSSFLYQRLPGREIFLREKNYLVASGPAAPETGTPGYRVTE
eukprot:755799-Hanusia_phi.AAC.1